MSGPDLTKRAAKIKLLVLDIDGVLTDGRVIMDHEGHELKFFDIKDGHGIKLLQLAGFEIAWLSGRASTPNQVRARELGIDELVEDCKIKLPEFERLVGERGLKPEQAAFMGDDLIDLPPMRAAGLALAPADAWPEVKDAAHWVATLPGGRGAVRQACELLLKAVGKWEEVTARYF
ncbi:MAG: phenylphosphate carboxylase subunit delta [Desulfarculaceae bacterium]|nr:phenylphosphate carboxylase subunit delta [Desulfarculaceae bacterium]MCF8073398.1 phenylphosphate carboxylase subunit delta [Desulfarculaceae bacterium]MCF8103492.1 phenylphosphate carboxylase subunit delta [Desulfarculaceae bacterium]MCF8115809.1 phenylphosphate carboxylase subunit delta [Desulfarculaceae bacterium]